MKCLSILSGLICLTYISACARSADSFKLVRQDEQISLYERWLSHGSEDVREIKVTFTVRSDFSALIRTLQDAQKGTQWNSNAASYQILATGDKSWINYIKYRLPWPFEDQDCCLWYHVVGLDDQHAEVAFSSTASNNFPERKGVSRITGVRGTWIMEQRSDGCIFVTYSIITDRSLNIPRCISDAAVHNNLFKTVMILKNILEKT